jgi:Protein of unknown function (DUF1054)
MLLRPPPRFPGFRREAFGVFSVPDREERRAAIIDAFHPALKLLADDLKPLLDEGERAEFHAHLPQLNWPKGYVPFCTWLAFSRLPHGYQAGPQLNVGIHADHVAARLAWDTSADAFGRFEFLCRHGGLGADLAAAAAEAELTYRVYAAAPWPEGSRLVFASADDWEGAFHEVARRGVFWEIGRRWEIPAALDVISDPGWCESVRDVFVALKPMFDRSE